MTKLTSRRRISLQVNAISPSGAGRRSCSWVAITASRACATMASRVQRRQDVQRRTWCSSRPARPFPAWVGWAAQRGGPVCGAPFPRGLPPNRTCEFPRIRLSDDLCRECCGGFTCVDVFMASGADDKGFASASGHERSPRGLGGVPWAEFGEIADVMDFHRSDLFAEFAPSFEEPVDQFLARVVLAVGLAVVDDRCFLPFEGDASEPGDQRFPACPGHDRFEAGAWPARRDNFGFVFVRHLCRCRVMFGGQRP